ncbi:unnamed protein product [Mytilus coruscus]|uniref:Uncharacterized protein n=1 Tax=Mytilus coruscus TaxID=42192 RepID=A0A6J8ES81_MYTCO|nr:unnamed protein product [Mytilus coruscus]
MDSQVVSGWDLITPVGSPLEVVVNSAETAEKGGFTLRRNHASFQQDVLRNMRQIKVVDLPFEDWNRGSNIVDEDSDDNFFTTVAYARSEVFSEDDKYQSSEESDQDVQNNTLTNLTNVIKNLKPGRSARKKPKRKGKIQVLETSTETVNKVHKVICYVKECSKKTTKNPVMKLRKTFYNMTQRKQSKFILDTLQKSYAVDDISPTFVVDQKRVCQDAWKLVKLRMEMGNVSKRQQPDHRTDNNRRFGYIESRIHANRLPEDYRTGQQYISTRYISAMMYFKEYAENFGEQQPDCPEIHLPSCLTKIAEFKDYKLVNCHNSLA